MKTILLWLAALLLVCSSVWAGEMKAWVPAKIKYEKKQITKDFALHTGSVVTFRNGKTIKAEIVELAYIGQLKLAGKAPVIVFSERPSDECGANTTLYFHSPGNGLLKRDADYYGYPGKMYNYMDDSLVQDSRLFLDECLPDKGEVAIWYDRVKDGTGVWKDAVTLPEVKGGKLHGDFIKPPLPGIGKSLVLVKSDGCREIPGRRMTSEP